MAADNDMKITKMTLPAILLLSYLCVHMTGAHGSDKLITLDDRLMEQGTDNLLKAAYGLYFKPAGYLQVASDRFYILIDVKIPRMVNLPVTQPSINCGKIQENYTEAVNMCIQFDNVMMYYYRDCQKYKAKLKELFGEIKAITGTDYNHRTKRAFPLIPIIGGLFSAAASMGNAYFTHKKLDALRESMKFLHEQNYKMNERFIDFSQQLITITQVIDNKTEVLNRDLFRTNKRISALSTSIQAQFKAFSYHINRISTRLLNDIRLLSYLTSRGVSLIVRGNMHYQDLIRTTQRFVDGLSSLATGRLPKELVKPHQLKDILDHSMAQLYRVNPNLEFTFTDLQYYYTSAETIYAIKDGHLAIELEVVLKQRNQEFLNLYHIHTTYVPFNMTDSSSQAKAHTKVMVDKDYFAVLGRNFVQISSTQLKDCKKYGILSVCEDKLLQIHDSKPNCISSIFWDSDVQTIQNLCDFDFYPKIQPHPTILDAGNSILLAGFENSWTLNCHDRSVPIRYEGYNYAIINRNLLCGCSLTSPSVYIAPHHNGCNMDIDSFRPKFVINAAVMATFYDKNTMRELNVTKLYEEVPIHDIPLLDFKETDDSQVLYPNNGQAAAKLKRLKQLVGQFSEVYLHKEDKSDAVFSFGEWFRNNKYFSLAFSFILSVLGGVALFIAIFACIRSLKIPMIAGALLTQKPTVVHASPVVLASAGGDFDLSAMIPAMLVHISFSIGIFLLLKLVVTIYKKYSILKVLIPLGEAYTDNRQCDIYMELNSGFKSCILYLCSLKANLADIHISGRLRPEIIRVGFGCCNNSLELDWQETNFFLYVSKENIPLPENVYIPYFKVQTVKTILKNAFVMRILAGQNGIFTEIGRKSHNYIVKVPKTQKSEMETFGSSEVFV